MSADTQPALDPAGPPRAEGAPRPRRADTWAVTWRGVRTVAVLELRQRVRSTRWRWALGAFAFVVGVVTTLTWAVAQQVASSGAPAGRAMFGFIVFFVLFLGLLVSPTLSATSVNGDRAAGTLATLQVTLLTPAEIVLGKLLAAWAASLAFLAVSVPFVLWAFAAGGTSALGLVVTLLLLAAVLAVVCAVGLGFSALTARTAGSAVLTYVAVAGLSVVSLVVFGLSVPLVSGEERVQVLQDANLGGRVLADSTDPDVPAGCELVETSRYVVHTERTWWLLAANPFVVVADAFPGGRPDDAASADPMSLIRQGARLARLGHAEPVDECWNAGWRARERREQERLDALPAVWPWGLGALVLLGAGGVVVAVRRLTIPHARLPRGTRVA